MASTARKMSATASPHGREAGFTLVEVLGSLGLLLALACAVGGAAAVARLADSRAESLLARARAVAVLQAEARMEGVGTALTVPGAEGAWAVTGDQRGPWEEWMGGFDAASAPPRPRLWRIEARERKPGGMVASFEMAAWPTGAPP